MPLGIRYEFINCERRASEIERLYWIMEQLSMDNYMSIRHIVKKCKCTRHTAKKDLDSCKKLLGFEPDTKQTPVGQTKGPCELVIVESRTPVGHQTDTRNERRILKDSSSRTSNTKTNSTQHKTNKPLGKRCKPELVTAKVAEVWNHWFTLNPKARTVNGEDARCIRTALKSGYSVDDLKLLCNWAAKSDEYQWQRDKGFTRCRNFLNSERIDGNHEKAGEWDEDNKRPNQPNRVRSVRQIPDHLLSRRFGPNGHLLPDYGGLIRPAGDY
jgi:hypothetical protein